MLEELNEKQIAAMEGYKVEGIAIGSAVDETDQDKSKHYITELYKQTNLDPPKKFIFVDSPKEAMDMFFSMSEAEAKRGGEKFVRNKDEVLRAFCFGNQDISWVITYMFFKKECFLDLDKRIESLFEIAKSSGWFLPCDDTVFVSRKPIKLSIENERLHDEDDFAVKYKDGLVVPALWGVNVPDHYITTPKDRIDIARVMRESNVEVRMAVLKKCGAERLEKDYCEKVLDKLTLPTVQWDKIKEFMPESEQMYRSFAKENNYKDIVDYELLMIDLKDGKIRCPVLKMENPSEEKTHYEWVTPECTTVREALAFRNGRSDLPLVLT